MYSKKLMEAFLKQENLGDLRNADAVGSYGSCANSDYIKLFFKIEDDVVVEAKAKVFGGVVCVALCSVFCTMIEGKTLDEVMSFDYKQLIEKVGEIPAEQNFVIFSLQQAVAETLKNYFRKNETI